MSFADQLRGCSLFVDLTDSEIEFLLKTATVIDVAKGVLVIREGEVQEDFFIVLDGTADVIKSLNTKILEIQKLKKMDHYGELMFTNQLVSPYDIVTSSRFMALRIEFARFGQLFKKKPEASSIFMQNLLRLELEKRNISLGLIGRLYSDGACDIGFPLFGNRRLSADEILEKKHIKMKVKWSKLKNVS